MFRKLNVRTTLNDNSCKILVYCICSGKQCLITKLECEDGVSEEESKAFTSEQKDEKPMEPTQEDSEDLVCALVDSVTVELNTIKKTGKSQKYWHQNREISEILASKQGNLRNSNIKC